MKRLLTYLGLLATLLAMPYHAKADNWAYYLYGDINGWNINDRSYMFGETSNSSDQPSWTKTFKGAQLDRNNDGKAYFKIIRVTNGTQDMQLGPDNANDVELTINGGETGLTSNNTLSFYITGVSPTAEYTIKYVSSSRSGGTISITGPATENTNIKLKGTFNNWGEGRTRSSFSDDGIYTWEFDKSEFPSGTQFKLYEYVDGGSNDHWYSNDSEITEDWSSEFSGDGGGTGHNIKVHYTDNDDLIKISVQAMKSGSGWKIRIVKTYEPHDYYWVSPQITNNQMWPAFKMVASRNRNMDGGGEGASDGKISTKYYTFTIKNEDLVTWKTKSKIKDDGNTTIQWYIVRDDGGLAFRPENDDPSTTQESTSLTCGGVTDAAVGYRNFMGYKDEGATRTGYFQFNKGYGDAGKTKKALAYTFIIDDENGNVFFNYAHEPASTSIDYDLVGNFSKAKGNVAIDLNNDEFRKDMTKYWYKGREAYKYEVTPVDSIVYKVEVKKPAEGWGDLYIDVIPDGSKDWTQALRPLISLGNNLDGRALHGALTTAKSEQSLNPEPSDSYQSYTFSFNATTRTYKLEFNMPDATLSPGSEGNNIDFNNTWEENITVDYSEATTYATAATKCYIGAGSTSAFTLDKTTAKLKDSFSSFTLTYDGSAIYMDGSKVADGSTVFFKIRGEDASGVKGEIHTYQYTFTSTMSFEPQGGLFINSAKIAIQGGMAPYRYEIHNKTTTENGETVVDYSGTPVSSGTFSTGTYADSDDNYRISTPGWLKIIDNTGAEVYYNDVSNPFDFTYSTSENYKHNTTGAAITDVVTSNAGAYPNGADYWQATPGDLTRLLSPTWQLDGSTETRSATNVQPSWNGKDDNTIPLNTGNEIYQTVTGLTAGTYTVQAIVRGEAKHIHLELNDTEVGKVLLTGDGTGSIASINPFGRCEHLENMQESTSNRSWHKLEGKTTLSADGSLKIAISAEGRAYVADVVLLKDANTTSGFRTKASESPTDKTCYDFRRRQVSGQPSQRQNNAYSFFDRGKNQNAVIFANNKTVIAMDHANLADVEQNATFKSQDRRHPFNVVGSTEQDAAVGTAKALYLTDAGYDESDANYLPIGYVNSSKGNNSDAYRAHGYSFCPGLAFYAEDLIFDRDMSQMAVKKTTCMLPVAFTPAQLKTYYGSNLKVYKWTSTSGNNLTFEQQKDADVLNANEPYIFWGAEGSLDTRGKTAGKTDGKFTIGAITYTDHNAAANHSGFPGTYAYKKLKRYGDASGAETDNINEAKETRFIYNAANGVFSVVSANGANLKPFRAYFVIGVTDKANEARQLNIFFDDSIITGIDSVETTAPTSGDIYTIGGVLVAKDGNMSGLPKGIYIMNGKKYVVK